MPSLIIYATNIQYLDRTIDDLLDRTKLTEIIVCDDANSGYHRTGVTVLSSTKIGRARAWNQAAVQAQADVLVFLKDKTKPGQDWLLPLLETLIAHPKCLVSPIVHTLDLGLWMTEVGRWRRFGWRWDLNLYDRAYVGSAESPAISSYCIACTKSWFIELGGFDDGLEPGAGEDIELSLRNWLAGGVVRVCDDSIISVALEADYGPQTADNLARIAETWFPAYAGRFYAARSLQPQMVSTGRLPTCPTTQPVEWFFAKCQPELFSIYNHRGTAAGKTIAIVAPGPSLDYLNPALINRHDIVIGIDYVGLLFKCDFVLTDSMAVVSELRAVYADNKLVVPLLLQNHLTGQVVAAGTVLPQAQHYELAMAAAAPLAVDPPFCNFENLALTAVHFALFLGPASVTVFGCDHKIIGGKSHTSKIEYYNGGQVWPDTDSIRSKFAVWEYGLDRLGQLAYALKIPLLRMGHA